MSAAEILNRMEARDSGPAYNYEHFRAKHLLIDGWRTMQKRGPQPGSAAPNFELQAIDGSTVRLSDLRGQVALLHLGSWT